MYTIYCSEFTDLPAFERRTPADSARWKKKADWISQNLTGECRKMAHDLIVSPRTSTPDRASAIQLCEALAKAGYICTLDGKVYGI